MIEDDIEDASVRAGAALRPFGCPRELETDRIIIVTNFTTKKRCVARRSTRPGRHRAKSVQASSARARPGGGAAVAGPRPRSARLCHEIPGHTGILISEFAISGIVLAYFTRLRTAVRTATGSSTHSGLRAPRERRPSRRATRASSAGRRQNSRQWNHATQRHAHALRSPRGQGRQTCGVMRTRAKRPRVARASKSICTHAGRLQGNHRPPPAAACFSLSLCLSVSVSVSLSLSRTHSLSRLAGCATRCTALKAQYVTNT